MVFQKGDLNYSRIHGSAAKGKTNENCGWKRESSKKMSKTIKRLYAEDKFKSWNAGLTKESDERLKKASENISLSATGRKRLPFTEEHRDKIREKVKGENNGMFGKESPKRNKVYEEYYGEDKAKTIKEKIKEKRAIQIFPVNDTLIELKIQDFLKKLNIDFFTHQAISKISHAYQCDILICPQTNFMSEKKTIIECDGDYWHCNLKKYKTPINQMQKEQIEEDACRNEELRANGFEVIRLWESEIKKMTLESFKEVLLNKISVKQQNEK